MKVVVTMMMGGGVVAGKGDEDHEVMVVEKDI